MVIKLSAAGIRKGLLLSSRKLTGTAKFLRTSFFRKLIANIPILFNAARSGIEQSKLGTLKARWNCYLPIFYLTKDSIADNKSHVK